MNIPTYSLENRKVIYFFLMVLLIGGIYAFFKLPKKEDSPFVIKQAVLVTQYPGATPMEVEKLITEPIEREIQSMSDVQQIKSESYFGLSKISIELKPTLPPDYMPVKWDELRRKVTNIQSRLPVGASSIQVNDDFGDVFGIYYALSADDGFTYDDMRDWAQKIKTLLTPVPGVQKVYLFGEQPQVINIFISISKLSNLGIDPNSIQQVLQTQNLLVNTGEIMTGAYQLRVHAEGTYKSIDDIREQLIVTKGGGEVRLGDIAVIEQGYADPPSQLMRVDGKRAIGIGVATGAQDDVVAVGHIVTNKLHEIKKRFPIGMDLKTIYPENRIAEKANNGFILNLIESLLIVIVMIFLVMGSRAGILVGSSLLFSVGGTLLIMLIGNIGLNRTSLAAFIIAMGMLVDNAIVVTDNAQIGIQRGMSRYRALIEGATKPQWALLGATFIAICSFLPMYLAPASVAEIVKPLFIVLAVSLSLSWILALTQTTTFGIFILKEAQSDVVKNPYNTQLYQRFEQLLSYLIKRNIKAEGDKSYYRQILKNCEEERSSILSGSSAKQSTVSASRAGYFSSKFDGYESITYEFWLKNAGELSPNSIQSLLNTPAEARPQNYVGKLQHYSDWRFLCTIPEEKARAAHLAAVEKGMLEQYTPQMKKLTFSQGKMLIKLIDRECQQTGYELIKVFMGGFKANFYQTFAALFGASLKKEYDPEVEDAEIEEIIFWVDNGAL